MYSANNQHTVLNFMLIMIGMALVSTVFNIIQNNIQNLLIRVRNELKKEIMFQALQHRIEGGETSAGFGLEINIEALLQTVLVRLDATHLRRFIPDFEIQQLLYAGKHMATLKSRQTQTYRKTVSIGVVTDSELSLKPIVIASVSPKTIHCIKNISHSFKGRLSNELMIS